MVKGRRDLEDDALGLLRLAWPEESSARGVLEYFTNAFTGFSGTFQVMLCSYLLGDCHALFRGDGPLTRFPQFVDGLWVASEIFLASYENDRKSLAEMHDFGNPFLLNVIERIRTIDCEADEDNVGVGV